MQDYKSLKVWQNSHKFTLEIYNITAHYPKDEQWGLVSQMRRSSYSIPTNIAEGCGRRTNDDFAHFLQMSLGSANEIEYQILLSADLNYISSEQQERLNSEIKYIKSMLVNLISKVKGVPEREF